MKLNRKLLPPVFSSDEAIFHLRDQYKAPAKALLALEKAGEVLRLRRGLYAFAEDFDPLLAASRVYGPSYISYETALSYYGLIPEKVRQVISVVDGRPARYSGQQIRYIYHSQNRPLFSLGMGMIFIGDHPLPFAIPEKAVLDTLDHHKLATVSLSDNDILDFVCEGLRIEFEELSKLSLKKMNPMAKMYRNLAPIKLVKALKQRKERAS